MNQNRLTVPLLLIASLLLIISALQSIDSDDSGAPLPVVPGLSLERSPTSAALDRGPTPGRTSPKLSRAGNVVYRAKFWPRRYVCVSTGRNVRDGWAVRWVVRQWNRAQDRVDFTYRSSCKGRPQRVYVRQYRADDGHFAETSYPRGKWVWKGRWMWRMNRVTVSMNLNAWGKTWVNNGVATPWWCQARSITAHEFGHVLGIKHMNWNAQPKMVMGAYYDQNRFCGTVPRYPNVRVVNKIYRAAR